MVLCKERPRDDPGRPTVATGQRRRPGRRVALWVGLLAAPLVAAGLVGALLGGAGRSSLDNQRLDTEPRSGPAPLFALPSLDDPTQTVRLADYRGQPVVLNFWASWCVPCRREMPRLAAAARRLEGRVAFVGVNYKDSREDALPFVRETGVGYPSAVDRDGSLGGRYGVYGIPTTLFIDPDGRILGRYLGEIDGDTLERLLNQLLEPTDSAPAPRHPGRRGQTARNSGNPPVPLPLGDWT